MICTNCTRDITDASYSYSSYSYCKQCYTSLLEPIVGRLSDPPTPWSSMALSSYVANAKRMPSELRFPSGVQRGARLRVAIGGPYRDRLYTINRVSQGVLVYTLEGDQDHE